LELGMSTWSMGRNPLEALERIAEAGFRQVEIWSDPPSVLSSHVDELFNALGNSGLKACSLHAPFTGLDVSSPDKKLRECSVQQILDAMETAERLGCRHIIVHPGSGKYDKMNQYDKAKRLLAKSTEKLVKEAEGRGLTLALENMLASRDGFRVGTRAAELREVIESLSAGNLGVCLDTGHAHYNGLEAWKETKDAGDLLMALHVNDNDGSKDEHIVPGDGTLNWPPFIKALKEVNYSGIFMLEIYGGNDIQKRLENSYKASRLLNR
jgi:sugar phosphate isomerase/epimerase